MLQAEAVFCMIQASLQAIYNSSAIDSTYNCVCSSHGKNLRELREFIFHKIRTLVPPEIVPGRMTLLVTVFLVLVNIFNTITTNIPKAEGLTGKKQKVFKRF